MFDEAISRQARYLSGCLVYVIDHLLKLCRIAKLQVFILEISWFNERFYFYLRTEAVCDMMSV
jgi:hypothetical protein